MLLSLASFVSLLQVCWSECPKTSHHPTATTLIPEMEVEVATRNFDRKNGTTQAAAECHVLQGKHSGAHKATFSLAEFRSADAANFFFRKLFLQFHRLGPALPNDSSKIHSCFSIPVEITQEDLCHQFVVTTRVLTACALTERPAPPFPQSLTQRYHRSRVSIKKGLLQKGHDHMLWSKITTHYLQSCTVWVDLAIAFCRHNCLNKS